MMADIIRRNLYAIPILLGVNIVVFLLFFFVNSPDDMARAHLGHKRVTPEQIDRWKREHSLDLPYFYNAGWRRLASLPATATENRLDVLTAGTGEYALVVEAPTGPHVTQRPRQGMFPARRKGVYGLAPGRKKAGGKETPSKAAAVARSKTQRGLDMPAYAKPSSSTAVLLPRWRAPVACY